MIYSLELWSSIYLFEVPSQGVPDTRVNITVQMAGGQAIPTYVNQEETVLQLKHRLEKQEEGLPFNNRALVFRGQRLRDTDVISDYDIQSDSTLFLGKLIPSAQCFCHSPGMYYSEIGFRDADICEKFERQDGHHQYFVHGLRPGAKEKGQGKDWSQCSRATFDLWGQATRGRKRPQRL